MLARICRGALAGLLACASLAVAGTAQATPENLKILTYNTAFLYLAAEHPSPVPPPLLCTACDPIALPPGIPGCECWPKISMEPNAGKYVDVSETDRALLMAQRIEATDQDVVVLNDCVTETNVTPFRSNTSTSLAKSASERERRSIL